MMGHKIPKNVLKFRHEARKGSIMKSSTFHKIQMKAMKRYHIGKTRAAKVAGAAYWKTVASHARRTR